MKLTSKGRYAVTAMLDLAIRCDSGPVSLSEISERQDISLSYLEQLFARLRKANLVRSVRGPGGGYALARKAKEISVGSVIHAVNETVDATRCKGQADCQGGERCLTHTLWQDLSDRVNDFLNGISLQDLISTEQVKDVSSRQSDRAKTTDINILLQV
ncbi:Fe-S cluster assembly transcriptional regulator IscR [Glaciecola sp. XM2]|uniref:Fe-S cluster assembly transcriptional regulator IscR n=1 Tax=Glaciecola sp. XM2 TaxID=1914931 RepID=UPI001BDE79C3|nr:Fe-S cluster assembly transcriptional regulator IscR [Glaciecola sp. XM2]MBT1450052.1 Fe-S cluster assembly transcriptional regulator IscR [Glaciecola sp. XM2]